MMLLVFFFLMSLKDELNNLFICYNKKTRLHNTYDLLGFILYSFTLSHYIICVYNYDKNVFILFDDEAVKEYRNIYELIIDITVNVLKANGKAFFYPVMLIYTQENIYDNHKVMKMNTLNDSEYQIIINKCNEAIYEHQLQQQYEEEQQMNKLQDYIEKQEKLKIILKKEKKEEVD